ncbi:DUF72 domain-containing protein [Pelagibacterium montanilacus]|uniref:DUF72 domain-containing protein n=1 Tax=Pelagibacterium montanilacus TaxID=2185280 RepID=UPI000F8F5700|nr:DUF72 domain-containing protein [Pelagibacterium montanilacus]
MSGHTIHIGVGGWTFAPWRGVFYPEGLVQKNELGYMASQLNSVEVNGTFYGSQKPETFAKWASEVPEGFVFSLKGPRFATNRKVLGEAGESIRRFVEGGIAELGAALGPINWQLAATKRFDPEDFGAFLALLPDSVEGLKLRHAVEVRHESFAVPEAVELARRHTVALVVAGDSKFPTIPDITADFVYLRLMGTTEDHPAGYGEDDITRWAGRLKDYAAGHMPEGLPAIAGPAEPGARDVFCYVISGAKDRNPLAAKGLTDAGGS